MLSTREDDSRLAPSGSLVLGAERAIEAFATLGISLDSEAVVRRLDLAAEICFEHPADGLLFLASLDGVHVPRHQQRRDTSRQTGQVTSVAWLSGRNVALRAYDAGLHHGTDAAGVRVRLERQVRFTKRKQQTPEQFQLVDLAALYLGPLGQLISAAPSIAAMAPRAAERELVGRYLERAISLPVMERGLGLIRLRELGLEETVWQDSETRARRLREMRRTGIFLDAKAHDAGGTTDVRPLLVALGKAWR